MLFRHKSTVYNCFCVSYLYTKVQGTNVLFRLYQHISIGHSCFYVGYLDECFCVGYLYAKEQGTHLSMQFISTQKYRVHIFI